MTGVQTCALPISRIDQAGQENVGYDTLKRQLGDIGVGFDMLKLSLRAASDSMSVTYEEAQRLGVEFARISGLSRAQSDTLAEQVAVGGGFGRSFGADPGRANGFFASMKGLGITNTTDDTRRMALLIGEGIAKSGAFTRTEELLQSVAVYAGQQTRSALAPANVGAYTGMLTGMVGSGIPGMDVAGSAAILGRVNGAIAGGGAAGEAGQAFMYRAIGSRLGLDPLQVQALQEGGAFGTGRSAFGPNSVDARYRQKFGGTGPGAAAESDTTNLEMVMDGLKRVYGGNSSLMASAGSRLLGLNISQFKGLASVDSNKLGGLSSALERNGINVSDLAGTSISNLATIATGGRGDLEQQARSLRGRRDKPLTTAESASLDEALKSADIEKLRDVLLKLSATRDQQETVGSQTRDSVQKLDKTIQDYADKMVPLTNDMRNAMVYLAGDRGKMTARGIGEAVRAGEVKDAETEAAEQKRALGVSMADTLRQMRANGTWSMPAQREVEKQYETESARIDANLAARTRQINGVQEYRGGGMSFENAIHAQESDSGRDPRTSIDGAVGDMQMMPKTFAAFALPGERIDNANDNRRVAGRYIEHLRKVSGGDPSRMAVGYFSGEGNISPAGAPLPYLRDTHDGNGKYVSGYVNDVIGRMNAPQRNGTSTTPLPGGAQRPGSSNTTVRLQGEFRLADGSGHERAPPVQIQTEVNQASPYGQYP